MKNSKIRLLSLAMAAAMAVTLTACGGDDTSNSTPVNSGEPGVSTPAAGKDSLVVATANETPSLHPYDHNATAGSYMNLMTFNSLFRTGMDLSPEMDLVESYENLSETEWTFKLKEGVLFHDGSEMTAEDVKASLDFAKTFPVVSQYTQSSKTVEVVDKYNFKIITDGPSATLLDDLCHHGNNIVPKKLIDEGNDFNKNPIGSGPFKYVKWTLGDKVEFVAFEDYFDKERAPKIQNVIWKVIPEGASRTIALEAGEADLLIEVEAMDVARLEESDKVTVLKPPSLNHNFLMLNNEKTPLDNVNVRKAINAAIDKEALVQVALNGMGTPALSQTPMGLPGHSDVNGDVYDMDLAKKYMADSGVDPSTVEMAIICSDDTKRRAGEVMQANLQELGIPVTLESMDLATYLSKTAEGDYTAAIGGYTSSTMLSYVGGVWHSNSIDASNKTRLRDAKVDELIDLAAATLDAEARNATLVELSEYLNSICPQVPMYQPLQIRAFNAQLKGVEVNGSGTLYLNLVEWAA